MNGNQRIYMMPKCRCQEGSDVRHRHSV